MRVLYPDPDYHVSFNSKFGLRRPWCLWKNTNTLVQRFKTKREANRAIPMKEIK